MMSNKKPSLSDALHEASGRRPANPPAATVSGEYGNTSQTTSRRGKKLISGHFDPAVSKQLKQLALDRNSNGQELLAEALNDLFVKYQKNPIA
jgi:hypothetical protein